MEQLLHNNTTADHLNGVHQVQLLMCQILLTITHKIKSINIKRKLHSLIFEKIGLCQKKPFWCKHSHI